MIKKDIKQLKKGCKLSVADKVYTVKSLVEYCTLDDANTRYYKVITDEHFILVISLNDDFAYFGSLIPPISREFPANNEFQYEDSVYKLTNKGYQLVVNIIFGNPLEVEGEVTFFDYCSEQKNKIISTARVSKDSSRADVVANIIKTTDISIAQ